MSGFRKPSQDFVSRNIMKTILWLIIIALIACGVWYWMGNHTIQIIFPWVP